MKKDTTPVKREKEFKSFSLELKDVSTTGEVTFQFAAWSKDLDGDIILKSAYVKTLKENAANIYHNRDHKEACGKPLKLYSDNDGAFCVSQLALKTVVGNDCYEQYKAGLVKGHSQEFETIKSDFDPNLNARVIKEVRLWGVTSVTTIPANLDTPTMSIKSATELHMRMKSINDMLRSGNISDALGDKFCEEYKKLSRFVVSKNAAMANAGLIHCDNCKSIIDDSECDDDEESENVVYSKCAKCGRFINKSNGKLKPIQLISADAAKSFKLFDKK